MIIKNENNFAAAPDGVHNAVCVDVVDLGIMDTAFGPKHKLRIVWELDALIEQGPAKGKRFLCSQLYGASIGKKSTLRAHLKSWRGRDFTDEEAREFDLEKIIGAPAQLVIVHNEKEGTVYANVTAVIKSKTPFAASGEYKRMKDRPGYQPPVIPDDHSTVQNHEPDMADDTIPF